MSQFKVGELSFKQFLEDVFDGRSEEGTLEKVKSFSWVEISIVSQFLIHKRLCSLLILFSNSSNKRKKKKKLWIKSSPLYSHLINENKGAQKATRTGPCVLNLTNNIFFSLVQERKCLRSGKSNNRYSSAPFI